MPNIFEILEEDHRRLEHLLDRLEQPPDHADFDHVARKYLLDELVLVASRHEACEELVFWPAVRRRVGDGAALTESGLGQERDSRAVLDAMRFASDEAMLLDQSRQLASLVRAHIAFEEGRVWAELRRVTTRTGALLLGVKFSLAGKAAPTRPHPKGPDTALGLATRGLPAAMIDRLRDRMSGRRRSHIDTDPPAPRSDPMAVLRRDHDEIESLLARLGTQPQPDPDLVNQVVRALSVHDGIEREHLYPLMRARLGDGNDRYGKWIADHGEVAAILAEIDRDPIDDPHRRELVARLTPLVRTHIAEEEGTALPELWARMADEELVALASRLEAAKAKAPTRPHSHIAGAGFGAKLSRLVAGPLDRSRDALAGRK